MNFNVANLPAVQAQLQRDAAAAEAQNEPQNIPENIPAREVQIAGSVYPAKQLTLENGQYRVIDHEK